VLGSPREAKRRAELVAERFPIVRERRRERAGELSGGQQKIIEIARATMLEPRVILMDEPSMGLDPRARALVFETISGLQEGGRTVMLVEQNARAGLSIAQHGAVMDAGTVRLAGAARDLLDNPQVAELYLGGAPAPVG
jgi:branched-chain amino acid transport system ATP-binding protein